VLPSASLGERVLMIVYLTVFTKVQTPTQIEFLVTMLTIGTSRRAKSRRQHFGTVPQA